MPHRIKVRELVRTLKHVGCHPLPCHGGSHQKWVSPAGRSFPVVIGHSGADVSRTVLASIRRILRREGVGLDLT